MKTTTILRLLSSGFLAAVLCLLSTGTACAQLITWTGGTGAWNDDANWDSGAVSTGTVVINDGLADIAVGTSATTALLLIADTAGSSGTVTVNGLLTTTGVTYVGGVGDGAFIVGSSGSVVVGNSFRIGGYNSATDPVSPSGDFILGGGYGYVRVESDAFLGHATANRTFAIGFDGAGLMDVLAGGTVASGDFYIGDHATASGTLNLAGVWIAKGANINLGDSGTMGIGSNVLNILPGGAFLATNTGTAARAYVGTSNYSSGIVNIAEGGTLSLTTGAFSIGRAIGSYGEVNVDGLFVFTGTGTVVSGTLQPTQRDFSIGYGGSTGDDGTIPNAIGVLNIGTTGTVIVNNASEVSLGRMGVGSHSDTSGPTHYPNSASGTANVDGLWQINAGQLNVGRSGDGYLNIGATGTVLAQNTRVSSGHTSNGIGYGEINVAGYMGITGWLDIGYNGNATVNVYAGGTLTTTADLAAGRTLSTTSGTANTSSLNIWGYARAGDELYVANAGYGTVNIYAGGTAIANTNIVFGQTAAGSGTAIVSGYLQGATLLLGNSGTGVLDIQSGGLVSISGTTIIANATSASGTLLLNGGVLETRQLALGAGSATILFAGGTLRAAANTDNFFVNFPELNLDAVGGNVLFDTQNFSVTATNALAGSTAAAFDKLGSGSLVLTANSSAYDGTINVRAGSLVLGAADTGATLGGTVNVASGASIRPAVDSTVNHLVIAANGVLDLRDAPLTASGNLTFDDNARWRYSITDAHIINVLGSINIGGAGTVILDMGDFSVTDILGTYNIASYVSISGDTNLDSWAVTGPGLIFDATLDASTNPGVITLNITAGDVDLLNWQGGDGDWDATSAVWRRGSTSTEWGPGAYGVFASGAGTVNVIGLQEITGLQFGNDGYTLAGTGTLSSDETININTYTPTASATINTALKATNLTKTGAGTLVLGGPAMFTGDATIATGSLKIASAGVLSSAEGHVAALAGNTATVTIDSDGLWNNSGALYIGDGGDGTLNIAPSGTLISGGTAFLGFEAGSSGTAIVSGLWQSSGPLHVGNSGAGTLIIETGGTLTSAGSSRVGFDSTGTGSVIVRGNWTSASTLVVGGTGKGSIEIASTGTLINGNFYGSDYEGSKSEISVAGYWQSAVAYIGQRDLSIVEVLTGGTMRTTSNIVLGNSAGGIGVLNIKNGGYLRSDAAIRLGATAGASGTLNIESGATVNIAAGGAVVGYLAGGHGAVNIATGGTLILDAACLYIGGNSGAANVDCYGVVNIDGFYQSGSTLINDVLTPGTYYTPVGYSGTGVLNIGATGTVMAGQLDIGREATATGTVTIAGLYKAGAGTSLVGSLGNGTLVIKDSGFFDNTGLGLTIGNGATGVGSMTVATGGTLATGLLNVGNTGIGVLNIEHGSIVTVENQYRQNQNSTLGIAFDPARTSPYITAGSAVLSGTLALTGGNPNYTPVAKASEFADSGILIFTATSGAISGDFTSFPGFVVGAPDYIVPGGIIKTDPGTGFATYSAGYRLAWNAPLNAHGTFTLGEGETFEVDTPLTNRVGEVSPGWDRRSLTKEGAGTLVLSGQNTFTGTLAVNSGTLRLGGPATHTYGPLVNNGVLDFGPAATAAPFNGGFRTLEVTSLAGDGSFCMTIDPGAGAGDQLVVRGNATGAHQLLLTPAADAAAPGNATTVLATFTGTNNATFTGGLDFDGTNYAVARDSAGSIILATNGQAGVVDPIRGIPGAQSLMWFASQDNLSRRLGELRAPGSAPDNEYSVWLRARAEHANLGAATNMRPFDMDLFGFELGVDRTLEVLPSGRILIGLYAGYGHAKQDFDPRAGTGTADGTSDQINLGFYAAWLHNAGWFANIIISGARYDNEFTSADQSGNPSHGKYNDNAIGASLELGRRIALDRVIGAGWFAEPSAQASHVRLMRDDYRTTGANRLDINASTALITRLRATLRAGRAWRQAEISARAGVAHETSSDGEIRIGAGGWRPNVDGTRAEAGVGLIWRPRNTGHLYFDYEFATGDAYRKPWAFSLGYRHEF